MCASVFVGQLCVEEPGGEKEGGGMARVVSRARGVLAGEGERKCVRMCVWMCG